jgi:hypothetical protein
MSILLLFGINVCMESNKINLELLNLGQISKKCFLSSNEPLQFGPSKLKMSDKIRTCSCHMIGRHVATSKVCIEMTSRGACFPRKKNRTNGSD